MTKATNVSGYDIVPHEVLTSISKYMANKLFTVKYFTLHGVHSTLTMYEGGMLEWFTENSLGVTHLAMELPTNA